MRTQSYMKSNKIISGAVVFVLLSGLLSQPAYAFFWPFKKKPKPKKEVLTPYQKLFKGKKVKTITNGLLVFHKVSDNLYAEFPDSLLGREFLLTSVIDNISDGGEGAPGQIGGTDVRFRFEKVDSAIVARMSLLSKPINSSGVPGITQALNVSHLPGIFKTFKIQAYTPDSTAAVVNLKTLFFEGSQFTKPFPSNSANGFYGFVTRTHTFVPENSSILDIATTPSSLSVQMELCYTVDHTLMGAYSMYENVPLTAVVRKMLYLLPEQSMKPRMATPRLGLATQLKSDFPGAYRNVENVRYAKRWNIQPKDSVAYMRGELVEPLHPIVFYIDSLLPNVWHPYVKKGAESWNAVFNKIGFKDVIRVKEFPANDSTFNADDLYCNTIRYSASWMNLAQTTLHTDTRTGEIVNASILLNSNLISSQYYDRLATTFSTDPIVRQSELPSDVQGEMIQSAVAQAVGAGLGLMPNPGAVHAYPVDSLRSASFTKQYGLASSVMTNVALNDIATAEDVKNGTRLVNTNPGSYDELAVAYLYKLFYGMSDKAELQQLTALLDQHRGDVRYAYLRTQQAVSDPRRDSPDMVGDNPLKALDYALPALRKSYATYYTELPAGSDTDLHLRSRLRRAIAERYAGRLSAALSYIGGVYIDDMNPADTLSGPYRMVDASLQKAAFERVMKETDNIDWLDEDPYKTQFDVADRIVPRMRIDLFNGLLGRLPYIEICANYFPGKEAYTVDSYMNTLYNAIWSKTLKHTKLTGTDQALQTAFLESLITVSGVAQPASKFGGASSISLADERPINALLDPYKPLPSFHGDPTMTAARCMDIVLRTQKMLAGVIVSGQANSDDLEHYKFLQYRITQALGEKK